MKNITSTRREWLKRSALLALTGAGATATQGKLGLINSALAASSSAADDYRALVCVFLYGGSDSFNMFVPWQQAEYDVYQQSRRDLAIDRADLITGPDASIGFNPNMPNLRRLYDAGNVAIIPSAGNLMAPLTRQDYLNNSRFIPRDLFSHNDQQEQWMKAWSSRPVYDVDAGWGGRMADLLASSNSTVDLPPQISTFGSNLWSPGNQTTPVSVNSLNGLPLLFWMDATERTQNLDRQNSIDAILNLSRNHPMEAEAARSFRRARDSSRELYQALENSPEFQTPFDSRSSVARQLRMVARLIASRDVLGYKRQIFFVGMSGGWDTHTNQSGQLPALISELDAAMASFHGTVEELGLGSSVTAFTASDFGRTLTSNGDGTDHGWSGHYMVMGNCVRGGRLYGDMPDYSIDGPDDTGDNGRLIPKTSVNQYGAVLGQWMGLSDSELNDVFPDLSNFSSSWRTDLAFMDV